MKKKNNILRKLCLIFWITCMVCICFFCYQIYKVNVFPNKYYCIFIGIIVFLIILLRMFILNKKTKSWILISSNILCLFLSVIFCFANIKIDETLDFLNQNLNAKYETNIYNIIVAESSEIKSIKDLEDKTIKLVNDLEDKTLLENSIKRKIKNVKLEYTTSISRLLYEVKDNSDVIVIVNSGNYDAMVEEDENYKNSVRIIDTIEIKSKIINDDTNISVTDESFVVYLSGIDTRSDNLPAKSLSDVNILLVVNPIDKELLMVNTPRDYYVYLHGINEMKDKLTHAGLVGGVKLSMSTLEDLYGIKIHYYVRINFNAVINLVDAIGGITINNDQDDSIVCWTDRSCIIKPGDNDVNGKCALAFARERYAYVEGDRHRGENQEQVITKIIDKVTSSETLINNYSNILESLNGTFETNITTEEIMRLVKMQIDDISGWTISTYNVAGSDLYAKTYSYENRELYVMEPDMETVNIAKQKIKEALIIN